MPNVTAMTSLTITVFDGDVDAMELILTIAESHVHEALVEEDRKRVMDLIHRINKQVDK